MTLSVERVALREEARYNQASFNNLIQDETARRDQRRTASNDQEGISFMDALSKCIDSPIQTQLNSPHPPRKWVL